MIEKYDLLGDFKKIKTFFKEPIDRAPPPIWYNGGVKEKNYEKLKRK